jgi:hypothetical protein
MLAATIAFVSVVSRLNQQAFGRAKQFHEELFIHSGRAGGYRVCNAVNRKRERQTYDASSYASSHAPSPSHASPRQDVTGKMAPSSGPFFLSSFILFLVLGAAARSAVSRRSRSRGSSASCAFRRFAIGHVAVGRTPVVGVAPEISLARQVIGVVAGISLSERWISRRGIVGLRDRARR